MPMSYQLLLQIFSPGVSFCLLRAYQIAIGFTVIETEG